MDWRNDLSAIVSEADRTKVDYEAERQKADDSVIMSGLILLVFFIVLTVVMATTLTLFAIGFFMAVTHWCDR